MESSGCIVRSGSLDGMVGMGPGGVAPIIRLAEEPIGVSIRVPSVRINGHTMMIDTTKTL